MKPGVHSRESTSLPHSHRTHHPPTNLHRNNEKISKGGESHLFCPALSHSSASTGEAHGVFAASSAWDGRTRCMVSCSGEALRFLRDE
jgi:hypothetical protein